MLDNWATSCWNGNYIYNVSPQRSFAAAIISIRVFFFCVVAISFSCDTIITLISCVYNGKSCNVVILPYFNKFGRYCCNCLIYCRIYVYSLEWPAIIIDKWNIKYQKITQYHRLRQERSFNCSQIAWMKRISQNVYYGIINQLLMLLWESVVFAT